MGEQALEKGLHEALKLIIMSSVCTDCKGRGYKLPDPLHSINCSKCKGTGKILNKN